MGRFSSAGTTDAGPVRGNNEDRYYIDDERGIYLVVDGMGGQAAGEEAAEIAVNTVRSRLERETESPEQRVREAIALANNAIFEAASATPGWRGMACVLTLALIEDGHAVVGHVGDSRLYQIRAGRIEKITRDHSPVGEREDAGELSEEAAMNHPRRNEVFRDVGSEPRTPDDENFIDVRKISVPADSALLLCSDGLSDVVPAQRILQVVEENASDCQAAVQTLMKAAVADGKDNVSVVLVEGEKFAESVEKPKVYGEAPADAQWFAGRAAFFFYGLLLAAAAFAAVHYSQPKAPALPVKKIIHVAPQGGDYSSIPEAIHSAAPGDTIELAPGTYQDKILLKDGLTIRSLRRNGAVIAGGVIANGVTGAALSGATISGADIEDSTVDLNDLDVTGTVRFAGASGGSLRASKVMGGLVVDDSASPVIELNYLGSVAFNSTGEWKLDGNAIQGAIQSKSPVPDDLRQHNVVAAPLERQKHGPR